MPGPRLSSAALTALREGLNHHQAMRLGDAAACYQRVLQDAPDQPDALHYLGVVYYQAGHAEEAVSHLERAVSGKPDSAEAFNHLGCALTSLARSDDAEKAFTRACALDSMHAEAHYNLGVLLHTNDRDGEARDALERAVQLTPREFGWQVKLAEVLRDMNALEESERLLNNAIRAGSNLPNAYFLRASIHENRGHGEDLRRDLRRCILLLPDRTEPLNNLAHVRLMDCDTVLAVSCMRRAALISPNAPIDRYNLANALLANGEFDEGWREFRWRHEKDEVHVVRRGLPPEWDGGPVATGGLLAFHEQGIGDELRFASCFQDLGNAAGAKCTIESDPRLVPLFSRSFPGLDFIPKLPRDAGPPTMVDYADLVRARNLTVHTALGELPRHLRPDLSAFEGKGTYLRPCPRAKASWRERLSDLGPDRKIGFTWRTGLASKIYASYFFDILDLESIFTLPGVTMVNLQYDDCEADLSRAETLLGVSIYRPEGIDLRDDLDDLAALVSELDLVVGPMTSVTAMAGGVGTWCIGLCKTIDWTSLGTLAQPWTPNMDLVFRGTTRRWDGVAREASRIIATRFGIPDGAPDPC